MADNGPGTGGVGLAGTDAPGRPLAKCFYERVGTGKQHDGWVVLLDGRTVRTPGNNPLVVPSEALCDALAAEWAAQQNVIDPASMPLTRIVNTALDGVAGNEQDVCDEIVKFAGSDLLCYRADHPQQLVARQARAWDAPLAWMAGTHGVALACAVGIMPVAQDRAALDAFRRLIAGEHALRLAALHILVTLSGSAVLGYGVLARHIDDETAWSAAHVDEDWQFSQWGEDGEARERRARRRQEFAAAARLLSLF